MYSEDLHTIIDDNSNTMLESTMTGYMDQDEEEEGEDVCDIVAAAPTPGVVAEPEDLPDEGGIRAEVNRLALVYSSLPKSSGDSCNRSLTVIAGPRLFYYEPPPEGEGNSIEVVEQPTQKIPATRRRRVNARIVVKYLRKSKLRFGVPTKKASNFAAVRKYIQGQMANDNTTEKDQSTYLDMVVHMTFIPTDVEIQASQLHLEPSAIARTRAYVPIAEE